jgi:hypothetical protein
MNIAFRRGPYEAEKSTVVKTNKPIAREEDLIRGSGTAVRLASPLEMLL